MDSIAVLVYRIIEKELIDDREAAMNEFIASRRDAVAAFDTRAFKLIKSTEVDAGKRHSDRTSYHLHVALEGVVVLADPKYMNRKERLEIALRAAPTVLRGSIEIELEGEELYSAEDYSERFSSLE